MICQATMYCMTSSAQAADATYQSLVLIHHLERVARRRFEIAIEPTGLRPRHVQALTILRDHGAMSQGALGDALRLDPAGAGGLAGGRRVTVTAARGGGYGPGTPREGWDHRDPWLAHALNPIGIDDVRFIHTELTMARESPAMSGLEDLEDQSIADAHAAIDALFTPSTTQDLAA